MRRRTWLAGGVAAGAAMAGLGWHQWQLARRHEFEQATAGLWQMRFVRPQGGDLDMASYRGRRLVLNFWATWCPPCVREMPELDAFQRQYAAAGWQVVGLAIDHPAAVREFLLRSPVSYPIGLAGLEGTDLGRRLGNDTGGLPFTVLFGSDGLPAARKLGETRRELLQEWATRL